MDVRIKAIHFTLSSELEDFVQKKLSKIERFCDSIEAADVVLSMEVKNDKEAVKVASLRLLVSGPDFFAEKTASSFEEAVDLAIDALKRQIEKQKTSR